MATGLLSINHDIFSSKLFDEKIFRQCAQSTKCHFDEMTGLLDEVSFNEVSHFGETQLTTIINDWAKILASEGQIGF